MIMISGSVSWRLKVVVNLDVLAAEKLVDAGVGV